MNVLVFRILIPCLALATASAASIARANPIEDFFKKLGNSISHPHRQPSPRPPPKKKKVSVSATPINNMTPPPYLEPTPEIASSATPKPIAAPEPIPVASAASVVVRGPRQDFPYGIPVPNKPGYVTSPYAPRAGFVDVRGFSSGMEVKDPFTGKVFLTP